MVRRDLFRWLWVSFWLFLTAGFAYYASLHPMDFRVYHYGARGVFDGTRPVYGPASGLGWPMHYRYPPLFLLVFAPFAALPLAVSAAAWVVLKMIILAALIRALIVRFHTNQPVAWFVTFCIAGPYVIQELRYGNAQFFIFALVAASFLMIDARPKLAAVLLALAICLKVWPLFFLPYLLIRGNKRAAGWAIVWTAVLTLLPAAYFGFDGNLRLIGEWARQESAVQLGTGEIWFPNQSLRGTLMRYLTLVDYSKVPDSNYSLVNVAAFNPAEILLVWMFLAGIFYLGLLALTPRQQYF